MSPQHVHRYYSALNRCLSAVIAFLGVLSISYGHVISTNRTTSHFQRKTLDSFFQKRAVTIAVMDSGLGGLSILGEAARRLREARIFERADFVFFNALFSNEGGYNSLRTRAEKIRVFESALESLAGNFHPDVILIGCNTLSVLYKDTPYSRRSKIPVVPIVDSGVELIAGAMREHPEASVVIFGTPTTISERTYPNELEKRGFAAERIRAQSCPELESFIENDPRADNTELLISGCVSEALQKMSTPPPPLLVSLNCTHYGYSLPFWQKAFAEAGVTPLAILNPNFRMTDVLLDREPVGRYARTKIGVRVVSMVEITKTKIESLAPWLGSVSPETALALRRYERRPGLFEWKEHITR